MIKWKIKYVDYNGDEQEEDFYFEYLQRIVDQRDGKKIAEEFKRLILKSYGEKSPDGRRFIKSEEKSNEFMQTEAYSELYMQLATEPGAAEKFITGVLPKVEQNPVPEEKRLA